MLPRKHNAKAQPAFREVNKSISVRSFNLGKRVGSVCFIRLGRRLCTCLYALRCHHEELKYLKAVQVIFTSTMPLFMTVQTYELMNILNIVSCNPPEFPTSGRVLQCFWLSGIASKKNVQRREEQALS